MTNQRKSWNKPIIHTLLLSVFFLITGRNLITIMQTYPLAADHLTTVSLSLRPASSFSVNEILIIVGHPSMYYRLGQLNTGSPQ